MRGGFAERKGPENPDEILNEIRIRRDLCSRSFCEYIPLFFFNRTRVFFFKVLANIHRLKWVNAYP